MRRNYSLVVDQCCQVHHQPDDGLRIQCCRAHRLTRCGTCPNADACCGRGHHRGGAGRDSSSGDGGGGGRGGRCRGRGRGRGGRGGGDDSGGDDGGGRGTGRGRASGGGRGGIAAVAAGSRRRRWRSRPRRERRPHRPEAARAVPTWNTYQPWPEEADDEVAPEARPPASRQEATRAMHPHGLSRSRAARTTTTTRRPRRRRHWPRRPEHTAPTRPRPALFDGRP
ncbi:hypothetical protein DIPPA_33664 [Diplonema papillatum]|nr:hypothetical protein DIPPA_33664 [Diplonema papillatum]